VAELADDITQSAEFRKAKLAALAEFAAGAGHEINNPVATIVGRVELLLKEETNPERRQALLTIGAQALRIRDMIGDVMLFARPPKPERTSLDLVAVIDDVRQKLSESCRVKSLTIERRGDSSVLIAADVVQLRVVISSLLSNSVNASFSGGTITIDCSTREIAAQPWTVFSVHDHGLGLSEVEREHLFDPFFSGRQAGRGLGFGLSKCWRIVEQHGGRIECESSPESGTLFQIFWPTAM
jgi:signal transduction histidine kinase